jgi:hypothetical protein
MRHVRDTYLGSVALPLLALAYGWDDATTPRTARPVKFRFYWSRCNAWQGFPNTYHVPRLAR